ncbi:MAG: hypothetical protein JWO13_2356 [Acidobacteriales bacterium]|nr:hypothetical protein [Terriglobales bacterium]
MRRFAAAISEIKGAHEGHEGSTKGICADRVVLVALGIHYKHSHRLRGGLFPFAPLALQSQTSKLFDRYGW